MYTIESKSTLVDATANKSWRTGKRAKGDITSSPRALKTPPNGASLAEKLAYRRRFLEEVDQNLGSQSPGRKSPLDTGHDYYKIVSSSGRVPQVFQEGSYKQRSLSGAVVVAAPPAFVKGFGTTKLGSRSVQTAVNGLSIPDPSQRAVNSAFANMLPDPSSLPIAETIVELASGNFPRLLQSLQKDLGLIKRLQTAGGDYLSVQFGWKPLVDDIVKVIKTLIAADELITGTSWRRKRGILPVTGSQTQDFGNWYYASMPIHEGGSFGLTTGSVNAGPPGSVKRTFGFRQDSQINAKFNRGARPTSKSNGFYEKGVEALHYLGFDQPSLGWQLTSFSWLFDWAVDIGKSLDNVAYYSPQTGRYPLDYAFITTKTQVYDTFSRSAPPSWLNSNGVLVSYTGPNFVSGHCFSFMRQPISPFKPGVSLQGLNTFQYSILVALGLAKSR